MEKVNRKRWLLVCSAWVLLLGLTACSPAGQQLESMPHTQTTDQASAATRLQAQHAEVREDSDTEEAVTPGTETYRGFVLDNVLHSDDEGNIHFHLYIPEGYDGSTPYALFVTLPGYEGLYFQGVGANLRAEAFGFEAMRYKEEMIIAAPQLNDWGETSADQTIALTEYLLAHYHIDPQKVYLQGLSGGGETGSLAVGKRPDLFTAYLAVSTKWDGDLETLAAHRTPVYLAVGEDDSYYGSSPLKETYAKLHDLYTEQGLTEREISEILTLDIKDQDYFSDRGYSDQHAGGLAFAFDEDIMGWLFSR